MARRALSGRLLQVATIAARSFGIDMALSLCTEVQSPCNPPAMVPACECSERTVAELKPDRRYGEIFAELKPDAENPPNFESRPLRTFNSEMPEDFDVDEFVTSWGE